MLPFAYFYLQEVFLLESQSKVEEQESNLLLGTNQLKTPFCAEMFLQKVNNKCKKLIKLGNKSFNLTTNHQVSKKYFSFCASKCLNIFQSWNFTTNIYIYIYYKPGKYLHLQVHQQKFFAHTLPVALLHLYLLPNHLKKKKTNKKKLQKRRSTRILTKTIIILRN